MTGVPNIPDLTRMTINYDGEMFLEKRMENDADGDPIYVGWAKAGSAEGSLVWFIVKITYDANKAPIRQQVATNRSMFGYSWTDKATYF